MAPAPLRPRIEAISAGDPCDRVVAFVGGADTTSCMIKIVDYMIN